MKVLSKENLADECRAISTKELCWSCGGFAVFFIILSVALPSRRLVIWVVFGLLCFWLFFSEVVKFKKIRRCIQENNFEIATGICKVIRGKNTRHEFRVESYPPDVYCNFGPLWISVPTGVENSVNGARYYLLICDDDLRAVFPIKDYSLDKELDMRCH